MSNEAETEVKKVLLFPREDVERFNALYPAHGSFTWFMRDALRKFVDLHEVKPADLIEQTAREVRLVVIE